jgi:hypothetical protein
VVKQIRGYFYRLPAEVIRAFPPGTTHHRHPSWGEQRSQQGPQHLRGKTGPGNHGVDLTFKLFDFAMFHLAILQIEDP